MTRHWHTTRSNHKTLLSLGQWMIQLTRFHKRAASDGVSGIKVHLWVCIRYARKDCGPKSTSIMREVMRMMHTINSARISAVHIWIWKVWERVLVVYRVQRKGGAGGRITGWCCLGPVLPSGNGWWKCMGFGKKGTGGGMVGGCTSAPVIPSTDGGNTKADGLLKAVDDAVSSILPGILRRGANGMWHFREGEDGSMAVWLC